MKNFSHFFKQALNESKFRDVDENLINNIKDTVKTYNLVYKKLSKSDAKLLTTKIDQDSDWWEYFKEAKVDRMAEIKQFRFKDLTKNKNKKVSIIVAYGGTDSTYAYYDEDNEIVVLNHDQIKGLSDLEIEAIITHELTHGFQEYKTSSDPYKKAIKKMSKGLPYNRQTYFYEPLEFDAHATELAHRIREEFYSRKEAIENAILPETKKVLERKLEKFLLELNLFSRSDRKSYLEYKELPLPQFCSTHEDFLETVAKNPNLWRKLKEKLASLYIDLTTEEEEEKQN